MWARVIAPSALVVLAPLMAACYENGANLTPTGRGRPELAVTFAAETEPGSIHQATFEVANPGPGDIGSLVVAFAMVGVPGRGGVADPLVRVGSRHRSPSVVGIRPRPAAVSPDGVVYRFDAPPEAGAGAPILEEGESLRIEFDIIVPQRAGVAANSVQA
jgi:hypothetical protein